MPRLASLFLPWLPIERIRKADRRAAPPEPAIPPLPREFAEDREEAPPPDEAAGSASCSCPRTPGFRPGARWARERPDSRQAGKEGTGGEAGEALVTIERLGQRMALAALSPEAQARGLVVGMALTQARLLLPDLEVREADREGDDHFLQRLARHAARRWSPRVAPSGPDGLWLDLTGVSHLFGGEQRLARHILAFCRRQGFSARIAIAGTAGAAHALARFGQEPITLIASGEEGRHLAPLPLTALRLEEKALAVARRLGVETVGELVAMPRAPLQRRFGSALLRRLDQALGRLPEPFDPVIPEDPPSILLRFMEPIATAEAIGEAMAEGLRRLLLSLERKGLGMSLFELSGERVDGRLSSLRIGVARPTRDFDHLLRLLRAQVERIDPGFGIERMRLTALRTEHLGARFLPGALAGEKPVPDLVPLVDRLSGRLGPGRLYRLGAIESDVPERSVRPLPPLSRPPSWPGWPRPIRLLSPPERIENVMALLPDQPPRRFTWRGGFYRVRQADGPERIHGEWWKRSAEKQAVRDYFQVEDEKGRRFWLFRRGDGIDPATGDLSWYLHGLFG